MPMLASTLVPHIGESMPEEQHITTAVGRDFGDVSPVRGVLYDGGEHTLIVGVDVERLE